MGGPGKAHHEIMERLRQRIKFGKWRRLLQDGPSFFGGHHFTLLLDRSFKVHKTRFVGLTRLELLQPCKVRYLEPCLKDFSDANRGVNRLKQTEDVGLLIHAIPLVNLRTLSISECRTRLETVRHREALWSALLGQNSISKDQQSCHLCPGRRTKWQRSISAPLAGEVFILSEGLAECEWISRVLESAVYQDYEPSFTPTEIDIITRRAHSDRHEGGQPSAGRPVHSCQRCGQALSIILYESRQEAIADGQQPDLCVIRMGTTREDGCRRLDE